MRRSIAVITACISLSAPVMAFAQGIGVKGGYSYGNVSNSGALPGSLSGRTGYAAGIALSSAGLVGFGLEALYAQRGIESATAGDSRKLDYVDVPLYLRVGVPTPMISPFAYAGPQLSYELKCRDVAADCADTRRPKTSYSAVIGGGVRLGGTLSFEGRYIYGLTDLKLNTVTTTSNYKTRSFLLLLGLGF
jgi:hypothetical protein